MIATVKLITRQQIRQYKQISNNGFDDKLDQIILEAQFHDLRPLLGETFYNDILKKVDAGDPLYDDLLNGSTYVYNGKTYHNYGLRAVLANYVYGRWAMFGSYTDNPFGITIKTTEESDRLTHAEKKAINTEAKNSAFNYWNNVRLFLIREDYTLFTECFVKRKKTFKISKI